VENCSPRKKKFARDKQKELKKQGAKPVVAPFGAAQISKANAQLQTRVSNPQLGYTQPQPLKSVSHSQTSSPRLGYVPSRGGLHAAVQKQLPKPVDRLATFKELQKAELEAEAGRPKTSVFDKVPPAKREKSSSSDSSSSGDEKPPVFANLVQKELWLENQRQKKFERERATAKQREATRQSTTQSSTR